MRIAVMGTGGLGGYVGGRLARAGNDVAFLARGARLEALRRKGLEVRSVAESFRLPEVWATHDPAEVGAVDLIILSVKSYDVVSAAEAMRPLLGPETVIVPVFTSRSPVRATQEVEELAEDLCILVFGDAVDDAPRAGAEAVKTLVEEAGIESEILYRGCWRAAPVSPHGRSRSRSPTSCVLGSTNC